MSSRWSITISPDILLLRWVCSSKSAPTWKPGSPKTPRTSPSSTATYPFSPLLPLGRQRSHDAPLRLHSHLDGLVQLAPGSLSALSESSRALGERHVSLPAPLPAILRESSAERSALRRRAASDFSHRLRAPRRRERILHSLPRSRRVSTFPRRSTTRTSSSTPAW